MGSWLMGPWTCETVGDDPYFEYRHRGEYVCVERGSEGDGVAVTVDESLGYQGCGHRIHVTAEMLAVLGYVKAAPTDQHNRTNHEGGGR